MSAPPRIGAIVRISGPGHVGIVQAVARRLREARVSSWPHAVPWTALGSA